MCLGGGYSGGKYLSYCVKEVYGVLYVCSLNLNNNNEPVQFVALDLYNPDTDDYKEVTFSSEIPNKYADIYEKYVEFINGIDFDKIAQRQYEHKIMIGSYSNSKETFTTSLK